MDKRPAADPPYTVSPHVVALSILLFWAFYYFSVTARALIMDYPGQVAMLDNRAWVSLAGMGFSWLLYLFLRTLCHKSLGVRVAAAFLASLPTATAYGAVNYASFELIDPVAPDMVCKGKPKTSGAIENIAENALHWYFFISCWAALYLALSYAGEARAAEREKARLRAAVQTSELRALRYQVNPHFLFNTLNSLSSLVMGGKQVEAEKMILSLSSFFRTSLSSEPTEDVPLADEIALQRLYLGIERVRFPDRLREIIDVSTEAATACVPGLILQPLVENAIKYGVAPAQRPIEVKIRAWRDGARLRITVSNDGDAAQTTAVKGGTGVGLRNVYERLRARFGGDASIRCRAEPDGSYVAELDLPWVAHGC